MKKSEVILVLSVINNGFLAGTFLSTKVYGKPSTTISLWESTQQVNGCGKMRLLYIQKNNKHEVYMC